MVFWFDEVVKMVREAATIVDEVMRMAKRFPKNPYKVMKTTSEVVEMVEVGCNTIVAMDHTTNWVYKASSEASNDHSKNMEEVIALPKRKGKVSRRYHPKVMKARWPATFSPKTLDGETYHLMLEKFVPPKFKDELLQEDIANIIVA